MERKFEKPGPSEGMVVTGGPAGDRELHVSDGAFGAGLIEAPTKLTVPYATARQMFVEGNQQAAMQAFMGGQIKVEGDMTKLMAMQSSGGDPAAAAAMQPSSRRSPPPTDQPVAAPERLMAASSVPR